MPHPGVQEFREKIGKLLFQTRHKRNERESSSIRILIQLPRKWRKEERLIRIKMNRRRRKKLRTTIFRNLRESRNRFPIAIGSISASSLR